MIINTGLTDRGTINLWSDLDPIDFELTHQSQQPGITPVILPDLSDHERPRIHDDKVYDQFGAQKTGRE
jgi:hypothetical protein